MNNSQQKPPSVMKRTVLKLWSEPAFRILMALGTLLGIGVLYAAWKSGITISQLREWFDQLLAFLGQNPLWLFLAIAILPTLPVPVSPLLILAGIVFIPVYGAPIAWAITFSAMLINLTWTYWLAATIGRSLVEKLFRFLEIGIPTISDADGYRLVLVMRITPGFPFFVQNLLLGFLRIPFLAYLIVSAIPIGLWTIGWVVSAGAIFAGKSGIAIAGISLLVVVSIVTGFIRKRMSKKVLSRQGPLSNQSSNTDSEGQDQ